MDIPSSETESTVVLPKRLWSRLALHAHRLEFVHPSTDDIVIVEAPLPQDLQGIF